MAREVGVHTTALKGLGRVVVLEVQATLPGARALEQYEARDHDVNAFAVELKDVESLMELGTAEDLFYTAMILHATGEPRDLDMIHMSVNPAELAAGLDVHGRIRQRRPGKRPTFRVVVQAHDAPWRQYRRARMQRALEQGIARVYPKWKLVEDDADVEFWIQQAEKRLLIGLRLSDARMRHRTYKHATIPASLRPTAARALVLGSEPEADDVFLDPMCGAGTVLLERAIAARYRCVVGGDLDPAATQAAATNFGPRHRPREICRWDARRLPIKSGSVTRICCNLPWGRQIGVVRELSTLYHTVLQEAVRVLRPGGIAIFLTAEGKVFEDAARSTPGVRSNRWMGGVQVLGKRAQTFKVRKLG